MLFYENNSCRSKGISDELDSDAIDSSAEDDSTSDEDLCEQFITRASVPGDPGLDSLNEEDEEDEVLLGMSNN